MSVQAISWAFSRNVDPGPKLLLLALANYSNDEGRCFPAKARLAKDCNLSERSVRNYLVVLEQQGLVVVEANYDKSGRQTANTILLNMEGAKSARGEGANCVGLPDATPSGVHLRAPLMNRHKEPSEDIEGATHTADLLGDVPAPKVKATEPPEFEKFMATFPKRDHSHPRKPTLTAFLKAMKKAAPLDIIAGAARFAAYCDREGKTGTQFVPMPTTWLNQERWTIKYGSASPARARSAPKGIIETLLDEYHDLGSGDGGGDQAFGGALDADAGDPFAP